MKPNKIDIPIPASTPIKMDIAISDEKLHDRILGALVGSAIGDAMGASTEMWDRRQIWDQHGYITGLTEVTRLKSPEGTWKHNMVRGATTDDTRWKFLLGQYIIRNESALNDKQFARFIENYYEQLLEEVSSKEAKQEVDVLEELLEKVNWIKEWARVAQAYSDSPTKFASVQNRFYGGEMSCAGLLFAPMFGLIASDPEEAYRLAFDHSIFDIGYARDISSLSAVMTYYAMHLDSLDAIMERSVLVDPYKFTDARLIGRLSVSMLDESRNMVKKAERSSSDLVEEDKISGYGGTAEEWHRQLHIYDQLDSKQKAIAFHAGEIWQILIAGLAFGEGDFLKTMQFIVNYGRDNDTVAAVAGLILGTKLGYEGLPVNIREEILTVSREVMGLDLEQLAKELSSLPRSNM